MKGVKLAKTAAMLVAKLLIRGSEHAKFCTGAKSQKKWLISLGPQYNKSAVKMVGNKAMIKLTMNGKIAKTVQTILFIIEEYLKGWLIAKSLSKAITASM